MQRMRELLGKEVNLDACNRELRDFARRQRPVVTGAHHVTCSDECEREQVESFQQWAADELLPELKFSARSPFRTANLGARYEWGAVRIAEDHYATPASHDSFKLMLIKINSHVAVLESHGEQVFGRMNRYDTDSTCCGALGALLEGTRHPAMDELRVAFEYDGIPRLDMLCDPDTIAPSIRPLVAAVVNARLQARSAIVDWQDYTPRSPTVTAVLPTVTINRQQRDTEFVVGLYWADSRQGANQVEYVGLGDDPSKYRISTSPGQLRIEDEHLNELREARDHRQLVGRRWSEQQERNPVELDERWRHAVEQAEAESARDPDLAQEALKTLLWTAADVAPVPMSVLMFAKGIAGVHRLYRVHRLVHGADSALEAREILCEVYAQVAKLSPDRARQTIREISDHFRKS